MVETFKQSVGDYESKEQNCSDYLNSSVACSTFAFTRPSRPIRDKTVFGYLKFTQSCKSGRAFRVGP